MWQDIQYYAGEARYFIEDVLYAVFGDRLFEIGLRKIAIMGALAVAIPIALYLFVMMIRAMRTVFANRRALDRLTVATEENRDLLLALLAAAARPGDGAPEDGLEMASPSMDSAADGGDDHPLD